MTIKTRNGRVKKIQRTEQWRDAFTGRWYGGQIVVDIEHEGENGMISSRHIQGDGTMPPTMFDAIKEGDPVKLEFIRSTFGTLWYVSFPDNG